MATEIQNENFSVCAKDISLCITGPSAMSISMVYLMMLSVAETICCQMVGYSLNWKLEFNITC